MEQYNKPMIFQKLKEKKKAESNVIIFLIASSHI